MLVFRSLVAGMALFSWLGSLAQADVRLPRIFSDRMVLQREQPIPVWGWAAPGEQVQVTLGEATATATAAADGGFRVDLPAQQAGGPHELIVQGKNTIKIPDVLVGEVWLCFGQSNMQWKVSQSATAGEDLPKAHDPQLRLCNVELRIATSPQTDTGAGWQASDKNSAAGFSAVAYYFGKKLREELGVPVGIINASAGAIPIESFTPAIGCQMIPSQAKIARLTANVEREYRRMRTAALDRVTAEWQEQARAAIAADAPWPAGPTQPAGLDVVVQRGWLPLGLYNGAIHPIIPYGIRGAVMYQGEANNGQGMEYFDKLKALIGGWRKAWGQGDFPVLIAQLAPWSGYPEGNVEGIWEAQLAALQLPNTGLAVTTDLVPNIGDIHPNQKREVGQRLALWALAKTYGRDQLVYSGPLFKSAKIEGESIRVSFDHAEGLTTRDGKPPTFFQIGTLDGFVDAQAKIDGDSVIVHSPQVPQPLFVRFGWKNTAQPNLVNSAGLPASPFRTDCQGVTFSTGSRFTQEKMVELQSVGMAGEIRYTLDGSTPTAESPLYREPLRLTNTTTIQARLFAPDGRSSLASQATYTQVPPVTANGKQYAPGLVYDYYAGRWLEIPDFATLTPDLTSTLDTLQPRAFPESFFCAHRLRGFIVIPQDGEYHFQAVERGQRVRQPSPRIRLTVAGQLVAGGEPGQSAASAEAAPLAVGRTVRVRLEGEQKILSLAEVQILEHVSKQPLQTAGKASQSTTGYGCTANRANDGNTSSSFFNGSLSSTDTETNPWWSVDLGEEKQIGLIKVFNRGDCCGERLSQAIVEVLDGEGKVTWSSRIGTTVNNSVDEFEAEPGIKLTAGVHPLELVYLEQTGTPALQVLYSGPGVERQEIPAAVLWQQEK
ncbi:MAG: chitobiase/beta-hexosaminidase C-terminal domain-containing protein [Pirellulales bacterium]|nr:chitobiase/beta-hexosaminidase C-terminal domain-containing protein [Pirellulales bacterium]